MPIKETICMYIVSNKGLQIVSTKEWSLFLAVRPDSTNCNAHHSIHIMTVMSPKVNTYASDLFLQRTIQIELSGHHHAAAARVPWSNSRPLVHKPWRILSRTGTNLAVTIKIVVCSSNVSDAVPYHMCSNYSWTNSIHQVTYIHYIYHNCANIDPWRQNLASSRQTRA